jgi:hypothetical protein
LITLREIVDRYRDHAGGFGQAVALEKLGFDTKDLEATLSGFDEDYRINRFLQLTLDPLLKDDPRKVLRINGFAQSHISIAAEIETIL